MARADEIRTFERRVDETTTAHGNAGEKLDQLERRSPHANQIKDLDRPTRR